MIIKAEMDSKLFDVNEELKKRNMQIESLEKQNRLLTNSLMKVWKELKNSAIKKEGKLNG